MSSKLRDLIRAVRAAKTANDERKTIASECAAIRTAFKSGKEQYRARNVSKLIFFHLLGYPTEFGQMECMNLMTSELYFEKRIGYLALSLLIDENHEVLTLVENQLKIDLASKKEVVSGLALVTIANIAGEDMSRDLGNEVANYLGTQVQRNIKKKACLAALRIIRRVPTMCEEFLEKLTNFTAETHNGVLLCSMALVIEALQMEQGASFLPQYTRLLPQLIIMLKRLVMTTEALTTEDDSHGIANPFLQVRILQLMRVLGKGNVAASEAMRDVLGECAINTDQVGSGYAILYECANTIFGIESDDGLRVIGINILGRFLVTRENNIRYVALNTLTKVVDKDIKKVQRHKNTIVECLRDVDVSIRRRALDLIYTLVNASNIRLLVPDLIGYLTDFGDEHHKEDLTEKICTAADRFAPSPQWYSDIMLRVLVISGQYTRVHHARKFIKVIQEADSELKTHCVTKLWSAISKPLDVFLVRKESLLLVGCWAIGELCDIIVASMGKKQFAEELVTTTTGILQGTSSNLLKGYCLSALFKIAVRFEEVKLLVLPTFEAHQSSLELDLQQRAWEYLQVLSDPDPSVAQCATAKSAVPSIPASSDQPPAASSEPVLDLTEEKPKSPGRSFLDDVFGMAPEPTSGTGAQPPPQTATSTGFLDDIFGSAPAAQQQPPAPAPASSSILDVFADPTPQPMQQPVSQQPPIIPQQQLQQQQQQQPPYQPPYNLIGRVNAFQNAHLRIVIAVMRPNPAAPHSVVADAVITNITQTAPITNVQLAAAVTKTASLSLPPMPSDTIPPTQHIVQTMNIDNNLNNNAGQKPIVLKVRLSYTHGLTPCNEEFISGFPSTQV